MRQKSIFILVKIIFSFYSCSQIDKKEVIESNNELNYIFIRKTRGYLDTIVKNIIKKEIIDSVIHFAYQEYYETDTLEYEMELPLSNSNNVFLSLNDTSAYRFKLTNNKIVEYSGKKYNIYKYVYDPPNTDDGIMFYFFEPTIGLLIKKSQSWGNYSRLIETSTVDRKTVFFIEEMIINDEVFFHGLYRK